MKKLLEMKFQVAFLCVYEVRNEKGNTGATANDIASL
ncbi:hypothetical protein BWGOE8_21730 [Bacillus mycoides]|uniref:Uncharacterized protein n=1 Tax=Bacillus mycoides TaxID=1405 RepID=A0A1E8B902_BACMY|nr:hypothetical protein BWGOE9_21780 [Bacillus mycoides]OFD80805.1 hypothetical protein BWGOE8_21730 [Bacillus mycoides]OFD83524.1 hypothetical protein BWGOE10_21910 [Bacillus mycoides]